MGPKSAPDQAAQQPAVPLWFKAGLVALSATQSLYLVALTCFLPEGWQTIFGIPTSNARLLAVTATGLLLIVTLTVWAFPRQPLVQRIYTALQQVRSHPFSVTLPIVLLLPTLLLLSMKWWGHILLGGQMCLVALVLYLADPTAWIEGTSRFFPIMATLSLVLGLGLRLWLLIVDYRWIDEGFFLSAAAGMLEGRGIAPLSMQLPEGWPIYPLWGYAVGLYGLWAGVFGLGLIQARALSYVVGLLSLLPVYATSRLWYGRRTAFLTVSVTALSILFLLSTYARADVLAMAATSLTMLVHIYACQKNKPLLHMAVGLLSGLALETHLTQIVFFVAWGGYYLTEYVGESLRHKSWLRSDPLWFFLGGSILGLAIFGAIHVLPLPDPARFLELVLTEGNPTGSFVTGRLEVGLDRYLVYWRLARPESLLIIAATLAAAVRRTAADRHWLLLMLFTQLGYLLVGAHNSEIHYTLSGLPIFLGSSGALVIYGLNKEERPDQLWQRLAYLTIVLALGAQATSLTIQHNRDRMAGEKQSQPFVTYIREHVPTDAAILAPGVYYPLLT